MATKQIIIDINQLHSLVGRLCSHNDELAGMIQVTPELSRDVHTAIEILDHLSTFLAALARKLKDNGDLPEPGRHSHYS